MSKEPLTQTQIIEKIQKIFALAANAGTQGEADAASAMAQRLMDQHRLAMADIEAIKPTDNLMGKMAMTGDHGDWAIMDWKITMAGVIANVNGCLSVKMARREVAFFGRKDQIEIVNYLTIVICRMIERMGRVSWKNSNSMMPERTYVQHFGIGASISIKQRMLAEREQANSGINALVVVDAAKAREYTNTQLAIKTGGKPKRQLGSAATMGMKAGNEVQWHTGLKERQTAPNARLGGK